MTRLILRGMTSGSTGSITTTLKSPVAMILGPEQVFDPLAAGGVGRLTLHLAEHVDITDRMSIRPLGEPGRLIQAREAGGSYRLKRW